MKDFELVKTEDVESFIGSCQRDEHIQQVAYSTYHQCLTQICFTCEKIRTNIILEDENGK